MKETADSTQYRGTPLKDREPQHIEAALGNLTEPEDLKAFLDLYHYAQEEGLGISILATRTGISQTSLSQSYNGVYEGDYHAIAERIRTFFWRVQQVALYGGLRAFRETQLATALWAVFERTRINRRIQLIEGPEQIGKTCAAREYADRNNSGRTVYASVPGGTRAGTSLFIWSLAEQLGLAYSIKLTEKRIRIRHALAGCDLIIIDEAHLVFGWTAQAQAEFWDYLRTDLFADRARGVVLVATNCDMLKSINDWRRASRYNVGQLLGRMSSDVVRIDPVDDVSEADVRLLVERYYEAPAAPSAKVIAAMFDVAARPQFGHYGLLDDIMSRAWTAAKRRHRKIDDDAVMSAINAALANLKTKKEVYA